MLFTCGLEKTIAGKKSFYLVSQGSSNIGCLVTQGGGTLSLLPLGNLERTSDSLAAVEKSKISRMWSHYGFFSLYLLWKFECMVILLIVHLFLFSCSNYILQKDNRSSTVETQACLCVVNFICRPYKEMRTIQDSDFVTEFWCVLNLWSSLNTCLSLLLPLCYWEE